MSVTFLYFFVLYLLLKVGQIFNQLKKEGNVAYKFQLHTEVIKMILKKLAYSDFDTCFCIHFLDKIKL